MNGAYHVHEQNPFFVQALHEHERLHAAVEQVRHLLEQIEGSEATCDGVKQITARIVDLRDQLRTHFDQEERGGYLEEAITRAPTLTATAAQLQRQHAEFLALADRMVADAQCGERPSGVWARLRTDYAAFAKKLLAHEEAENRLLERAFNEDLGGDDA